MCKDELAYNANHVYREGYDSGYQDAINEYRMAIEQNLITNVVDVVVNDEIARHLRLGKLPGDYMDEMRKE